MSCVIPDSAKNDTETAEFIIDADYDEFLICENEGGILSATADIDKDGVYETIIAESENAIEDHLLGDVSGDGEISADDAQIVLQEYVNSLSGNLSTFSNELFTVADVNKDGEISVDDAQYILLYYGNTLTNTPVTWEELIQN